MIVVSVNYCNCKKKGRMSESFWELLRLYDKQQNNEPENIT